MTNTISFKQSYNFSERKTLFQYILLSYMAGVHFPFVENNMGDVFENVLFNLAASGTEILASDAIS